MQIQMVGVWAMCLWEQMGQPNRVNLVELGPGRGTLMVDLLRHQNLKCMDEDSTSENVEKRTITALAGTPVSWHAALEQVPSGIPMIIIAHEFYDALPVHQFQRASRGWCEKLVDVTEWSSLRYAYVEFASVRHSAEEASASNEDKLSLFSNLFSKNVSVHGPITQSQFLGSLGINFRVEALLQNCTKEQPESLRTGYWRLVGDDEAPFWKGPDD
ncbi:hypothetical protein Patl1_22117 [Pistacia atlantica]|uniref:Uncharacterized protein n=1 Tax=Pistacia atlantica TaxID=434234 RepID=A0ACC1BMV0_9ROSI|nr:hypothetical protein Patl1_22117 [Pistacia atlantica]